MPEVQRVDEFTGEFYFTDEEDAVEWCYDTSFVKESEAEEVEEIINAHEVIGNVTVKFEVPSDLWTGYCEDEPQDVRDVLRKVETGRIE